MKHYLDDILGPHFAHSTEVQVKSLKENLHQSARNLAPVNGLYALFTVG